MSQLHRLLAPIPPRFLTQSPHGMTAVDHTWITQRLLEVLGPYSLQVAQVIEGGYSEVKGKNRTWPGGMGVVGAVVRLIVTVDGREVVIEEAGGVDNAAMIESDGERLKHAVSDGLKRCSMRLGLGVHVWAGDVFYLTADRLAMVEEHSHDAG
jgi:hypothetical protein